MGSERGREMRERGEESPQDSCFLSLSNPLRFIQILLRNPKVFCFHICPRHSPAFPPPLLPISFLPPNQIQIYHLEAVAALSQHASRLAMSGRSHVLRHLPRSPQRPLLLPCYALSLLARITAVHSTASPATESAHS
ncbi:hypothetical protein CK203_113719 [Vitis vinifera]|uniref:Uncharacterized protein n=1 Tax=Vitis vinifera TaxID=29760 RepID=A0A438CXK6_VITVI|nr:hypothetical protein CK203_113719 [Vitis vinifera]